MSIWDWDLDLSFGYSSDADTNSDTSDWNFTTLTDSIYEGASDIYDYVTPWESSYDSPEYVYDPYTTDPIQDAIDSGTYIPPEDISAEGEYIGSDPVFMGEGYTPPAKFTTGIEGMGYTFPEEYTPEHLAETNTLWNFDPHGDDVTDYLLLDKINTWQDEGKTAKEILEIANEYWIEDARIADLYGIETSELESFMDSNARFWENVDKDTGQAFLGSQGNVTFLNGVFKLNWDDSLFTGVDTDGTVYVDGKYSNQDNNLLSDRWYDISQKFAGVDILASTAGIIYDSVNTNQNVNFESLGDIVEDNDLLRSVLNTLLTAEAGVGVALDVASIGLSGEKVAGHLADIIYNGDDNVRAKIADHLDNLTLGEFSEGLIKIIDAVSGVPSMSLALDASKTVSSMTYYWITGAQDEDEGGLPKNPFTFVPTTVLSIEESKHFSESNFGLLQEDGSTRPFTPIPDEPPISAEYVPAEPVYPDQPAIPSIPPVPVADKTFDDLLVDFESALAEKGLTATDPTGTAIAFDKDILKNISLYQGAQATYKGNVYDMGMGQNRVNGNVVSNYVSSYRTAADPDTYHKTILNVGKVAGEVFGQYWKDLTGMELMVSKETTPDYFSSSIYSNNNYYFTDSARDGLFEKWEGYIGAGVNGYTHGMTMNWDAINAEQQTWDYNGYPASIDTKTTESEAEFTQLTKAFDDALEYENNYPSLVAEHSVAVTNIDLDYDASILEGIDNWHSDSLYRDYTTEVSVANDLNSNDIGVSESAIPDYTTNEEGRFVLVPPIEGESQPPNTLMAVHKGADGKYSYSYEPDTLTSPDSKWESSDFPMLSTMVGADVTQVVVDVANNIAHLVNSAGELAGTLLTRDMGQYFKGLDQYVYPSDMNKIDPSSDSILMVNLEGGEATADLDRWNVIIDQLSLGESVIVTPKSIASSTVDAENNAATTAKNNANEIVQGKAQDRLDEAIAKREEDVEAEKAEYDRVVKSVDETNASNTATYNSRKAEVDSANASNTATYNAGKVAVDAHNTQQQTNHNNNKLNYDYWWREYGSKSEYSHISPPLPISTSPYQSYPAAPTTIAYPAAPTTIAYSQEILDRTDSDGNFKTSVPNVTTNLSAYTSGDEKTAEYIAQHSIEIDVEVGKILENSSSAVSPDAADLVSSEATIKFLETQLSHVNSGATIEQSKSEIATLEKELSYLKGGELYKHEDITYTKTLFDEDLNSTKTTETLPANLYTKDELTAKIAEINNSLGEMGFTDLMRKLQDSRVTSTEAGFALDGKNVFNRTVEEEKTYQADKLVQQRDQFFAGLKKDEEITSLSREVDWLEDDLATLPSWMDGTSYRPDPSKPVISKFRIQEEDRLRESLLDPALTAEERKALEDQLAWVQTTTIDSNSDGVIDARDALAILHSISPSYSSSLTPEERAEVYKELLRTRDFNYDGRITINDALTALRHSAGLEPLVSDDQLYNIRGENKAGLPPLAGSLADTLLKKNEELASLQATVEAGLSSDEDLEKIKSLTASVEYLEGKTFRNPDGSIPDATAEGYDASKTYNIHGFNPSGLNSEDKSQEDLNKESADIQSGIISSAVSTATDPLDKQISELTASINTQQGLYDQGVIDLETANNNISNLDSEIKYLEGKLYIYSDDPYSTDPIQDAIKDGTYLPIEDINDMGEYVGSDPKFLSNDLSTVYNVEGFNPSGLNSDGKSQEDLDAVSVAKKLATQNDELSAELTNVKTGNYYGSAGFNILGYDIRGYDRDHLDTAGNYDPEARTDVDELVSSDKLGEIAPITKGLPAINTGENESTGDGFFYNRGTGVHNDQFWVGGSHIASDVNTPDYNPSVSGFNFNEDAPEMIANTTSPRYNADPYATLGTNTDAFKVDKISRYQPTKTATTPTATSNFSGTTFNAGNSAGRYNIDATKAATAGVKAEQRNGQFDFDEAI